MAGINTTGLPNTGDYNLGRGRLFLSTLGNDELPTTWRDLGNVPAFNASQETETLEHQSSLEGLQVTDKEVVISQKLSVSVTLDELNFQNLALFLSGAVQANLPNDAAGFAFAVTSVVRGAWYNILDGGGNRCYGILNGGVTGSAGATEGEDFDVDYKMGRVFIRATTPNLLGNSVTFTVAVDALRDDINLSEIRALTNAGFTGALMFIGENPIDKDKQTEWVIHKITLKPDGDLSLIGDEITTMNLTGVAERNTAADANSPFMTVRTHTRA